MSAGRTIPTAYHLVDERNWDSVRANGLLSAKRLASAAGYDPLALRRHRASGLVLPSGARIRDQSPMPPRVLARCLLDGLQPEDWYDLLNSKVFFWLDPARLNRQRLACGTAPQRVLVIDAVRLLATHAARAAVSPINSGNAMRAAAPRGRSTFVPYAHWVRDAWPDARPRSHRPVELAIEDDVIDIFDYVTRAVPLGPGEVLPTHAT